MQVVDGAGNDTIDTSGTRQLVFASLGAGNDHYEGGPGFDLVSAELDTGIDHISTGGGSDAVIEGNGVIPPGERPGPPTRNIVDLGPGEDNYEAIGEDRSTVDGGSGRDSMAFLSLHGGDHSRFAFDLAQRTERRDGHLALRWRGFESYGFALRGRSAQVVGTPGVDRVALSDSRLDQPISVRLLAGDDEIRLDAGSPHRLDLDAGAGRDELSITNFRDRLGHAARIDLAHGTLRLAGRFSPLLGIEDIDVAEFDRVDFTGGNADDRLRAIDDCNVTASGGLGDDRLAVLDEEPPTSCPGATLRGGPGDDDLIGGRGDDTLVGGPGTDVAHGNSGTDTCAAETRLRCEN